MIIVPIYQNISSRFSIDIELDNNLYHIKIYWNAREFSWYMDIQDINKDNTIIGIKLVLDYLLLDQYKANFDIDGEFIVWDLEQKDDDGLSYDNLGIRYQLLYIESMELTGEITIGTR